MTALQRSNVSSVQVALNASTATLVLAAADRTFGEVKNMDAAISVYLGASGVTSSTGHLLKAGEAFTLENVVGALYAIAASGTPTVSVIQW